MATKQQMSGMLGVYLTAAELTRKELVVSITSRNARGADLLATDQSCKRTWSIQVKTNRKPAAFWLLNKNFKDEVAEQHIYVLVNLRGNDRPDFYVVPSWHVAKYGRTTPERSGRRSIWHAYYRADANDYHDNWSTFEVKQSLSNGATAGVAEPDYFPPFLP